MKNEKTEKLRSQIREYIRELNGDVFPNILKDRVSVFLSGSTGWGITEGFDSRLQKIRESLWKRSRYR